MVLSEHVIMLNALRITYAAHWKVYAQHDVPEVLTMIEEDVHTMYNAYIDNGDLGAYVPDLEVAHLSIKEGELPC